MASAPGRQFARAQHRAVGYLPSLSLFKARKESESQTLFYTEAGLQKQKLHSKPWSESFLTLSSLFSQSDSSAEHSSDSTENPSQTTNPTPSQSSELIPQSSQPALSEIPLFGAVPEPTVALDTPPDQEEDDSADSQLSDNPQQTTTTSSSATATEDSQRTSRESFLFQLPSSLGKSVPISLDFINFPYSVPLLMNESILNNRAKTNQSLNVHSINLNHFITASMEERSFMSAYELLSLYSVIVEDPLRFLLEPETDSVSSDTDYDYSEEPSSQEDYDPIQPKPTRSSARIRRVKQPSHFSYPHAEFSVTDEEGDSSFSDEPDVLLIAATSVLAQAEYQNDETEWSTVQRLFQSMKAWPPDYIQEQFAEFVNKVLPNYCRHLKSEILHDLMIYVTTDNQELGSVESQLVFDPMNATSERIAALIISSLIFGVCSESESERVLSISSHICPPRRSSWSLIRMNHSLLIHLGIPPHIPESRSDLPGKM